MARSLANVRQEIERGSGSGSGGLGDGGGSRPTTLMGQAGGSSAEDDRGPSSEGAQTSLPGVEAESQATVEAAIDAALGMTFPASDPPAWGSIARAASETDEG